MENRFTARQSPTGSLAGLELVDSHAHLDMPEFDADREAMLERARDAGVRTLLAIAVNPDALEAALAFAERHDWIYAAAGVHPQEAKLATQAHYEKLSRLAQHPRFLAWGEIGLDYHYEEPPRERAAARVRRTIGAGARRALAGGAALPGCLGGLPGDSGAALARRGVGGHLPLLHGHAGTGAARD